MTARIDTTLHGIGEIPIAEVDSLSFTQPIFICLLAAFLPGERFNAIRVTAIVGGFMGVLIILRPGYTEINFGTAVVLGGALSYAC